MRDLDISVYKVADKLGKRNDVAFIRSGRETFLNIRAMFLRRDFDKNLKYRASSIQDLGVLKLEKVSETEFGMWSRLCKLKRTVEKIPLPVETKHVTHFMYVGSPDGSPECQLSTRFALEHAAHQQIPNMFPSYYYGTDEHIYVADYSGNTIGVKTMFKDPRQAAKFATNLKANCSVEESIYTPSDMIKDIETEMWRHYAGEQQEEVKPDKDQITV